MLIVEFLSGPLWQRIGLTLVHFLWQGLAIAVLVGVLVRVFRLKHGNTRYAGYLIAFIAMIACPVVTFTAIDIPLTPNNQVIATIKSAEVIDSPSYTILYADDILPEASTSPALADSIPLSKRISEWLNISMPWILVIWVLGVIVLSGRLVMGFVGVYRWRHHLEPLPERLAQRLTSLSEGLGMRRFSRVFISPCVLQAMAVGYLRPMVLLPMAMVSQMQPEVLEAVIAHELAHIRRFDLWINLLQRVTETLLFYHPGVWWLSNCIRCERELCCDELAVKATGERITYATTLERLSRARLMAKQPILATGLGQDNKPTLSRVRHILGLTPTQRNCPFWLAGVITVVFLAGLTIPTTLALTSKSNEQAEASYRVRKFVRLVIGKDEMTFQGKQTTWDQLDNLLDQVENRNITVLEVGFTEYFGKKNNVSTSKWLNKQTQWRKVAKLREQFGFEYLSFVGKHKLGTVSGGTRNYLVRPMEFGKKIETNLPSAEDKPLVYLSTIEFSKDKAVIRGMVTSYPKTKWDIQIAFFDQNMKRLDYVYKNFENSGHNVFEPSVFVRLIEVDLLKIKGLEKAKFFELSIKQSEKRGQEISQADPADPVDQDVRSLVSTADRYFKILSKAYKAKDWQVANEAAIAFRDYFRRNNKDIITKLTGHDNSKELTALLQILEDLSDDLHDSVRDEKLYLVPAFYNELSARWVEFKNTLLNISGNIDIAPADFNIHVDHKRGLTNLVVSIQNDGDATIPEFKLRYYRGNPENNLDEAGNNHSGWHNSGPIKPGKSWNERSRDFHLPDGRYEFYVVLDYDNTISETDENNNTASIKVLIKNGQIESETNSPQISTSSYILIVPADLPLLKEIISDDKTKMITPEKLEEFLASISKIPGARMISAPKLIINDGEFAEIRIESAKDFESVKLNIKNTVSADRKTVTLDLDFEYTRDQAEDQTISCVSTKATVLSGHSIVIAGRGFVDGQQLLLLVTPKILEKPFSMTGVVDTHKPVKQVMKFKSQLQEPVTVQIDKSPDGDRRTIQYAVMAVCKAAGVPYNEDKSAELADPERSQYIEPVNIENNIAGQAIADMVGPLGLLYGVDENGVYLYKPEKDRQVQSNLEILDIELEPVAQGKNILYATIKNTSNKEQLFAIHIYTRSVDYGPKGIGWGTPAFEKLKPNETKRLRFVYKIHGPVTKNTYLRTKFYNPATEKDYILDKPFAVRLYKSSDLPKPEIKTVTRQWTNKKMSEEIFKTFEHIQTLIKNNDSDKAWGFFSEDYQKSEYQRRGLEAFKLHMKPEHPLHADFHWDKQTFVMLKRTKLEAGNDNIAKLTAEYKNKKWTIDFVYDSQSNKWKIDDILGYRPAVLDMQEADNK